MAQWTDALRVLGKLAPSIASAAGGPLAGTAVASIESAFGLNKSDSPDLTKRQNDAAAAIANATPDQLLSLKKADQDFQTRMTDLGFENAVELAKLADDDRDSARRREISVRDWTPAGLAIGVTFGFFGLLTFMCVRPIPAESKDVLNILLGSLGAGWVSIVSYYFGSSADSSKKTDLLAGK